mgnify:FL=1
MDSKFFLVGSKKLVKKTLNPFDDIICDFFDSLSQDIFKKKKIFNDSDILTLGFWLRKKNILKLKNSFYDEEFKRPLGIVFHITPNNVPINFAYSLFFGLITGNTNIVKVPSKKYLQVEYLCQSINNLLKIKKFNILKEMINIIRYENDDKITEEISKKSNARIIWGGDQTVKKIKNISAPIKCVDITFPDRYSFSVVNLEVLKNLNNLNFLNFVKKFYTDNYTFDQNACNSSHLVFWIGKKKDKKLIDKFWIELNSYVTKKVDYPETVSTDKYNKICTDLIYFSNIKKLKIYSKSLHVVTLNKLIPKNELQRGQWGYFYQYLSNDISILPKIITEKYQTLSYFGLDPDFFKKFIQKNEIRGIDRIVPIGRSMEMNYLWDGYNLLRALTRIIDIK